MNPKRSMSISRKVRGPMKRRILASAVVTAVSLMGGAIIGVGIGVLVDRLPIHAPDQALILLALIPIFGGGAFWGYFLTRIHNLPNAKGASIAGSLSFGLGVIGAATLLGALERILVKQHHLSGVPIHVKFTLLFVPATFLVATLGGSAILLVNGNRANWFRSALVTGLAASISFLIMNLVLDTLGMRVGAPRAVERATMLTVAFLGSTAAAFAGGAILGRVLSRTSKDNETAGAGTE
jgi:hypothetical protein